MPKSWLVVMHRSYPSLLIHHYLKALSSICIPQLTHQFLLWCWKLVTFIHTCDANRCHQATTNQTETQYRQSTINKVRLWRFSQNFSVETIWSLPHLPYRLSSWLTTEQLQTVIVYSRPYIKNPIWRSYINSWRHHSYTTSLYQKLYNRFSTSCQ